MSIDDGLLDGLLRQARDAGARWADAQRDADLAKADYHHAIRRLHLAGASLREIADELELSHQRVHQIVESSGGRWRPRRRATDGLACTFCGAAKDEVARLIAGPDVFICDTCVVLAQDLVRRRGRRRGHLGTVPRGSAQGCSFCGQPADAVDTLVAGPGVRICDQCVQLCDEIMAAAPDR